MFRAEQKKESLKTSKTITQISIDNDSVRVCVRESVCVCVVEVTQRHAMIITTKNPSRLAQNFQTSHTSIQQ